MSIRQTAIELTEIDKEIKLLRKRVSKLTKRKKQCEQHVLEYLESTDSPGIRIGSTVIRPTTRTRRKTKKKADIYETIMNVMSQYGVDYRAAEQIMEELKGSPTTNTYLAIK